MKTPLEKIVVRLLAGLAMLFFILTATYYSPSEAMMYLVFFFIFLVSDLLLPSQARPDEKRWQRTASRIVLGLLVLLALALMVSLSMLWKLGPFGHLP